MLKMINMINRFTLSLGLSCLLFGFASFSYLWSVETKLIEVSLFGLSSLDFSILIVMDSISLSFGYVVLLISSCVFWFASTYMKEDPFFNRFILVLLGFVISMMMLIFAGSILMILLGWDGLGITSFVLIIYYQNKEAVSSGFLTLIVNRLGDVLIVSSIFFMVIAGYLSVFPLSASMLVVIMILVFASLTKSAQYPFSPWLPAAMAAPTPVSALVHSSTLVTAGVYLVIRLSMTIKLQSELSGLLCFVGSVTCLLGGMAAIWETDIKKMIALSTLSQLGVMMFSLSLNYPFMALFHLYTHAMFKALLFLVAGVILLMSFGVQDLRLLGGVMIQNPILIVFYNISSLCLVGAPFMSAFYTKHCILELMLMSNVNMFSVITMGVATLSTAVYVTRSLKVLCWSKVIINISSSVSSLKFFFPLSILGFMGIISGKMFSLLNSSVVELLFLPNFWMSVINIVTMLGVGLGFMLRKTMKSWIMSTLFFSSPGLVKLTKPFSKFSENLKNLDYGWLEPMGYFYPSGYLTSKSMYNMFLWPWLGMGGMLRGGVSMMLLLYMCYLLL
uniref:NADH-ubiquinone oxidoreductase chain 5 n=1 Tax=Deroceras reticulatum TaxID=145610 RepID=A0A343ERM8_DERRE|nr:NADH dehydrogenase subunit 5 [Deroceras reticulatum]ASL05734.1 NADH dehydrogenase subunit 5 [Deroceras reticulatum]